MAILKYEKEVSSINQEKVLQCLAMCMTFGLYHVAEDITNDIALCIWGALGIILNLLLMRQWYKSKIRHLTPGLFLLAVCILICVTSVYRGLVSKK